MPTLPPIALVSRVVLNFQWNGEQCANVLHYLTTNGTAGGEAGVIGAKIASAYSVFGKLNAVAACQLNSIIVTPLDPSPPPSAEYSTGMPIVGTYAGESMPNNVSVATTFRTAFRGRSFRGRAYWVGLGEGATIGNVLNSTVQSGINGFWENVRVLEPATGEPTYTLCVLSYWSGGALRGTPVATPVTSVSTNTRPDSQRRRLP